MLSENLIPSFVNPDLQKERDAATFNVEEFAIWWHGGVDKLHFKRKLVQYMLQDMKDDNMAFHYESHEKIYDMTVKQAIEVAKKLRQLQEKHHPGGNEIWPKLYASEHIWCTMPAGNVFAIQFLMVLTALKSQGTDKQYERFGKRVENFEICATYAQTELGHGTYLKGLQTRADYDRETNEFVLNTPTLTAYKWWPGALGQTANYGIIVAQLYIDNAAKGIQMFFVQLRDEDTHIPMAGIDIGDIGKKMGFYGMNNGYLGLKNVRIPRANMLMRNARVLRDGTFIESAIPVLTYLTMLHMRVFIAHNMSNLMAISATIATRYSAVRRQSPINKNEPEPQIIDHVTQQLKLFPQIATAIAYHIAQHYLGDLCDQTSHEIERGNYVRLPEMHALSCCLKALSANDAAVGADKLRLACGGHGYMTASNLGSLYASATAACTYEGENTVLQLQVGRFLIKSWRSVLAGNNVAPTIKYLNTFIANKNFGKWSGSWNDIVKALQYGAANKICIAYENLSKRLNLGQTEAEAFNQTGIELTQAAELHGRSFVCAIFLQHVSDSITSTKRSASLNKVLEDLLELYLVDTALRYMTDILRCIPLTESDLRSLQTRLEIVLQKLRPNAVAICDGFDYHDAALSSALGSYDGNVYERLFESAKRSTLNKELVPKAFYEHLRPFLKSNM